MGPGPIFKFARDTSVTPVEAGVYEGSVSRDWWIVFGPNGGFIAALIVRALEAAVGDAGRTARSLTIHYTAAPKEGRVRIHTTVERAGRSQTTVTARMEQDGRLIALAIGAFSAQRVPALEYDELPMPDVPPPEDVPAVEPDPRAPRFSQQWQLRPAVGKQPFGGTTEGPTRSGGWIRPLEEHPLDAALVAQLTDAWLPAVFTRLAEPNPVPTIDLTIHFRTALPLPADYALVVFESRLAGEGFIEEDGLIWARDGRLIAQSRQLALMQRSSHD